VPNEAYICTLYFPKNKRAIAYQLEQLDPQSAEKSVIKIFRAQEEKALHEIQHAGKIKSMHWVKQDLFAVTTVGSSDIVLYNYQRGELDKTLFIPQSGFPQYSTLVVSSSYLVSSTYATTPSRFADDATTHLHIYDTEKFSYKRIQVQGIIANQTALTISTNHLLFCEISVDRSLRRLSLVHAYNLQTGAFVGQVGESKNYWCDQSFLALLNNECLFRAHLSCLYLSMSFLDQCHPSSQPVTFQVRNHFLLKHASESFFCTLPQGGIAVVSVPKSIEKSVSISIYHPLESKTPEIVTCEVPLELKTPEDVTSFLAKNELPRLTTAVGRIANALRKLSLFPEPVEKLVTAYNLSSEAQEDRFVDEIVESSWPKPQ